jgi:hypothetical protein
VKVKSLDKINRVSADGGTLFVYFFFTCVSLCISSGLQPLKSLKLTEHGIPEWAEKFIMEVPLDEILDLAEAATHMRIKM